MTVRDTDDLSQLDPELDPRLGLAPDPDLELVPHLPLGPEAAELLFRAARTANTFTDEPVTDEQLRAIYDLVKWAPTSMNTQPLRIMLVRTREARERLVQHMAPGNRPRPRPHRSSPCWPRTATSTTCSPGSSRTSRAPATSSPTTPAREPAASTARCRSPTSSSASAPRGWPPAR